MLSHVVSDVRYKKFGHKFRAIESFIKKIADSENPRRLIETANKAELSASLSLDLSKS